MSRSVMRDGVHKDRDLVDEEEKKKKSSIKTVCLTRRRKRKRIKDGRGPAEGAKG